MCSTSRRRLMLGAPVALVAAAVLTACGSTDGSSVSPEGTKATPALSPKAVMSSQGLTGCVRMSHADLEFFVTRGWKCKGDKRFFWFGTTDAANNWKKVAGQMGWAGKSGDDWAIENDG